jgi:glycosyltransferase involved in cell wall biosynthesis
MNIAFYAPLKSPGHPVPSGDRLMARQLIAALELAGHSVEVVSEFRSFLPSPDSSTEQRDADAAGEIDRISAAWGSTARPDLWICYHPYYKAPDLLGPPLCRRFDIAYVTVETSYSSRRNIGRWAEAQEAVLNGVRLAAVNICLTERDRLGLAQAAPDARLVHLPPFIDATPFLARQPAPQPGRLMTVAMMRPGDKLSSYAALADALSRIHHLPWTLCVIGDGPVRPEVEQLFSGPIQDRVQWLGQKSQAEIAELLSTAWVYVWPGHGEAYGLAYLEAQAAGAPVVAEAVAGVPEAVADGRSGVLTPPEDAGATARAIEHLLQDADQRRRLGQGARDFVTAERSIEVAAGRLHEIITSCMGNSR